MTSLDAYLAKRDFDRTPEPRDAGSPEGLALRYSIQKHDATRLHFDLRLEWEGALLSWAVTRGPSLDPREKRLAVRTEDHPIGYLGFEGVIPEDSYGAGRVMLWDLGHWQPLEPAAKGLAKGHLSFALHGQRLTGRWTLVRMRREGKRENWLLIKGRDEAAGKRDPVRRYTRSVGTRRTMTAIGRGDAPGDPPARKASAPKVPKPQLATLTDDLADPETHWHELKFDGYRALVPIGKGGARILTRSGLDWSDRFAPLLPAFEDLPCDTALIDGEIAAGAGLSGFGTLQKAIKAGGPFTFQAFDLLHHDGEDLAGKPLEVRRAALDALLKDAPPLGLLQASPVIRGAADEVFAAICKAGGEGLIAKRLDTPYASGRSRDWLKVKCEQRAEFVVVGWQRSDKRSRPFASLALAARDGEALRYVGKTGTGFDADAMREVADRLAPLERGTAPVKAPRDEARGVVWVTPELVAEVKYAEMTGDGRLRQAVFLGLREDKPAGEVRMEKTERKSDAKSDRPRIAGIAVSSTERVVFPEAGITKGDVAEYYATMADRILDCVADRPVSLVRLPEGLEGERFFQRHAGKGFPDAVKVVEIEESDGETKPYIYLDSAAGLVGAAQMGAVEFHVWGARRDRMDRPDRMVFDLDPDDGVGFAKVRDSAAHIRDVLARLGLESWPLLTGGKGVHVVVDLHRSSSWDTMKGFAQTFATHLAEAEPDRFTAKMSKKRRQGKIFVDWLRNERSSTAIAPFSLRARAGAPAAVPVTWDELAKVRSAAAFDIRSAQDRDWPDRPGPQRITGTVIAAFEEWVAG
ncbi:DNA ligase D [uncultured Jannaschia sp.]|uniref:DNA ligase D n=1 Tax=uncultured Jannaschia sp. TaxID=293347 RepID=UPI00261F0E38|nr:DNA ligase D [uncultured Jannaschia sp.]